VHIKLAVLSLFLMVTPGFAAEDAVMFSFSNEKLQFAKTDILDAQPSFDSDGRPVAIVKISSEASGLFGIMTGRHVGETMDMFVCGTRVSSPRIMSAIHGGSLMISGDFDTESVVVMAAQLKTSECNVR
jgi:SecD/SecF fusion protein